MEGPKILTSVANQDGYRIGHNSCCLRVSLRRMRDRHVL
jgi:hypothetical protein